MKKYSAVLILAALLTVLCLGLTACREKPGAETAPTTQPTPSAVQTPAVEPAPTPEFTPAPTPTPEVSAQPTPTAEPTPLQGECYTLNAGGWELTLAVEAQKLPDWDYYRVNTLKVYDGSQLLSTTDTTALKYEGDYLFDGAFFLRGELAFWNPLVGDFNFDGFDDLCLMATDGTPKNMPFAYFLWNQEQQRLDFSFVLANPLTVDAENRTLVECVVGPAGTYEDFNTYQFDEQGKLTLISTRRVEWG